MTAPALRSDYKSVLRLAVHPPVRETRFWIIQAAVFIIAGLHLVLDLHVSTETGAFPSGVPVALLILPVGYAALRYALAGAAATAALAILLWLPDLLLPRDLGHVGGDVVELTLIVVVAFVFGRRIDAERFAHVRTESALAKTLDIETRYHRLFETIRSPMLVLDQRGIVTDANPAATKLLGDDVIGKMDTSLLGGDTSLIEQIGRVVSLLDGHDYRLDVALLPDEVGEVGTQVIFEDVTEERNEGRRARRYAQLVIQAEEDQNRRLARELHDEPLQLFLLLARRLESLGEVPGVPRVVADGLAEAHHQSLDAAGRLRSMARGLRPPTLDQLGLVAALSSLVDDIEDESGPVAELLIIGVETRLNSEIELGSFRIVQEAIRNTLRHSEASRLSVAITFGPDELTLNVTDNGHGFNPESPSEQDSEHLGLLGMRERSRRLDGRLEVHSVLGRGTEVVATIPLNK
jgi:signal transduction histidine kinase